MVVSCPFRPHLLFQNKGKTGEERWIAGATLSAHGVLCPSSGFWNTVADRRVTMS